MKYRIITLTKSSMGRISNKSVKEYLKTRDKSFHILYHGKK